MATPNQWHHYFRRPDLAVLAARQGDAAAREALRHVPLPQRLEAERKLARARPDLVATMRGVGDPGAACCQACAEGRACDGTVGACCQACAEGRACEGKPAAVGQHRGGALPPHRAPLGAEAKAASAGIPLAVIAHVKRQALRYPRLQVGSFYTDGSMYPPPPGVTVGTAPPPSARPGASPADLERNRLLLAVWRSAARVSHLGASDDTCPTCPPGMYAVETPYAIPNRYICIFPDQTPPTPTWSEVLKQGTLSPTVPAPVPMRPTPPGEPHPSLRLPDEPTVDLPPEPVALSLTPWGPGR
jgi:hypothetical protein